MVKKKSTWLQAVNVYSLYLYAEIQLPQFWLRDPAVPQIHSLVKFSLHPIRKRRWKMSGILPYKKQNWLEDLDLKF